jgi:hypothetical protein
MARYKKLGIVRHPRGESMWQFEFDYSLLLDSITEVYVVVKPKPRTITLSKTTSTHNIENANWTGTQKETPFTLTNTQE